jgi:hypothetical protein
MVDITPTPRVLRTLGQIPFAPWQCLAELIDNSIDGFSRADREGIVLTTRSIMVSWPTTSATDGRIEVFDTGPGMTLEQLGKCVRAGYSDNDPMNNLGLFGMGFNIATARMGDRTEILSATPNAAQWTGIEIDFSTLVKQQCFNAPTRAVPKDRATDHGTKIIVTKLDPGTFAELKSNVAKLRRNLEEVYSPLLEQLGIEIFVQGKVLSPRPHCLWSQTRYVIHKRQNIPAVIEIDDCLGESLFDSLRNRYLSAEEQDAALVAESQGHELPNGIVRRQKRIHGWLGIQRYSDPTDFGIDLVRNGRKIRVRDKSLFEFNNPVTLKTEVEYPIELASTAGGRIVGVIHIDHVPPTYQKNDFHRSDPSWQEVVDALRGAGPILPKRRKELGYHGDNTSPLGRLINAYRRGDAGTKCLAAPNSVAREFAEKFANGHVDFLTDEKWWQAAVEQDRLKADQASTGAFDVDAGDSPSDDVASYLSFGETTPTITPQVGAANGVVDPLAELRNRSTRIESLSRDYKYTGCVSPIRVVVYAVNTGSILDGDSELPCYIHRSGNQCEFFFNKRHPFLATFPTSPSDLLLLYLAERIKIRDNLPHHDIAALFCDLMLMNFQDRKLDLTCLQERVRAFLEQIREHINSNLGNREAELLDCIHESAGEVEETATAIAPNPDLLHRFQSKATGAINAVQFVPNRTLVRVIDRFPEEFFDGTFFRGMYSQINLGHTQASDRLRGQVKDRILALLKDAVSVFSEGMTASSKEDLHRIANCIDTLNRELSE